MGDWITGLLLIGGGAFALIAAVGLVRMPDVFIRMHAATKAGTLGAGLALLAVAVNFAEIGVVLRSLAAIAFLVLTAPVAAHLIGRAAYRTGVPLWERTEIDEWGARPAPYQPSPDTPDPEPATDPPAQTQFRSYTP